MYNCTSFRGAKHAKLRKKGCVFGHVYKYWLAHVGQIKKEHGKNAFLQSAYTQLGNMCLECVFKVLLQG